LELSSLPVFGLAAAFAALFAAGLAKGVSGMGIPLIATPVLALLFDLQTAVPAVVLATLASDIIFLSKTEKRWPLVRQAGILLAFGAAGTALGSYLLARLNPMLLSGALGAVVLLYVAASLFSLVPAVRRRAWLDAAVGLIGGTFQGAAGASGPIVGMYLLQRKLSRNDYLFLLNAFFLAVDGIQIAALYRLGLYQGAAAWLAPAALVPVLLGLAVSFKVHGKLPDARFRGAVLLVMTFSAVTLLYKSVAHML